MIKHLSITLLGLTLTAALSVGAAIAAPTAQTPPATTATPGDSNQPAAPSTASAAKSDLAQMSTLFKNAKTLSYSSTITIATDPRSAPQTIDMAVSIQRPNLVRVELDQQGKMAGLVLSNGKTCYAFDPIGNRYIKTEAKADAASGSGPATIARALELAGQVLNSPASDVLISPGIIMFLSPDSLNMSAHPSAGALYLSDVPDKIDGTAVSHITQTMKRGENEASVHILIDKTTGLPKRFAEDITLQGKSLEVIREDFNKIDLAAPSLDAANFTWTPPNNAKLFKPVAPQEEVPKLANGAKAPDFTVLTLNDKPVHLSDYRGKVVVLDFWATWCGPCQMSLPHTDSLARIYKAKGVVFMPVCTWDEKAAFRGWVRNHKSMKMTFYFDPAAEDEDNSFAYKLYKVESIPTQFVIGKDGKIAQGFVGYDPDGDPGEKALRQALDKAVATP